MGKKKGGLSPSLPFVWPPIRRLPSSPPPEDQQWGQCASQGTMIDPWPNHTVWPALSVALVLTARLATGAAIKPPKPTTSLLYTPIGRLVHRELDKHVTIVRTPAEMLACLASYSPHFDAPFLNPPSAAWQRSCPSGGFVVRTSQSLWHWRWLSRPNHCQRRSLQCLRSHCRPPLASHGHQSASEES